MRHDEDTDEEGRQSRHGERGERQRAKKQLVDTKHSHFELSEQERMMGTAKSVGKEKFTLMMLFCVPHNSWLVAATPADNT